ncbi:mannose-1-phosphate guanylyltransferase [Clostridium tetanomorphum]|uniref:mannose-1-phosphate guanylyltransferase n=1 Tax=Clostridium tetanomorphum TaxID=1553 RepID=A0A923E9B9_CLOTT|nr:mannose-1-phosphate guanylyltransferase [Clostridium tetanomorphum]MBC2397111.1 mannose-1-phosphate guanylyltransferase [Clostridium tetanomorphum]NRZ99045.1 mannose-1-phosphate guanylyltransferase [Clostridium tetanomorphum]
MLCALIMAGGKGERFWPLSTDEKPKQFLKLLGEKTMIQMTIERLKGLIPIERIFIVTAKRYVDLVKEQVPSLPERNIIVEPVGKNTAPCIGLSAFIINKYYKDASLIVLPSDHLIVDVNKFQDTLKEAYEFVEEYPRSIVTLGMKPDRPETGYGYIKLYDEVEIMQNRKLDSCIYEVEKFVEKPNLEKAKSYLEKGNYLWNGGMFLWKVENILHLTEKYLSSTYNVLNEIAATSEEKFQITLEEKYPLVESISIDYGIMEKADNIYVIPCDFGWDDIGTWYAVERYRNKDCNNNVCVGEIKSIESTNSIVFSREKPIVVVGLDDVFVVESEDIIFVGKKDDIEKIKEIKSRVC